MAAYLLKAGHVVTAYNRTPPKTETLIAQSAKAAGSIAETERRVSSPVLARARNIFD